MPSEGVWALFSEPWGVVEGFWANRCQSSCSGKLLWWQYVGWTEEARDAKGRAAIWAGGDGEGTRTAEVRVQGRRGTAVRENAGARGTWAAHCLDVGRESGEGQCRKHVLVQTEIKSPGGTSGAGDRKGLMWMLESCTFRSWSPSPLVTPMVAITRA